MYGGHVVDTSRPSVSTITYTCRGKTLARKVVVKEGSLIGRLPYGWVWGVMVFLGLAYVVGSQVNQETKKRTY